MCKIKKSDHIGRHGLKTVTHLGQRGLAVNFLFFDIFIRIFVIPLDVQFDSGLKYRNITMH
ncbi:hypothetical protein NECAME_03014 [Necator americanus]|uniref:Uncharacterized protein n=1 Tax=Necator americanus TaxID=51031 RepID=W2T7R1_NECAM|nr:hypothetical protein NECAME_03014 [Necator americanus]ETN78055.1 hypothetical protein NECAME_03014 [Necator americanus]